MKKSKVIIQAVLVFISTFIFTAVIIMFLSGGVLALFMAVTDGFDGTITSFIRNHFWQSYLVNGAFVTVIAYGIIFIKTFSKPKDSKKK